MTTSILPLQSMVKICHNFLWIYTKSQTRSKAGPERLQQFLNLTGTVYFPDDLVFYSVLNARNRVPISSSSRLLPYLLKTDLSLTIFHHVPETTRHTTDGGTCWPAWSSDHFRFAVLVRILIFCYSFDEPCLQHALSLTYTELCVSHALPLSEIPCFDFLPTDESTVNQHSLLLFCARTVQTVCFWI